LNIIDLSVRRPGCTGHPVTRLNRVLRELHENRVIIRVKVSEIPIKVLEKMVLRRGYKVAKVNIRNEYAEIKIVKSS